MIEIIAHRGLRADFPENTCAAIEAALELSGVRGVEFDVEITKDNKAVVLHQETVAPSSDFTRIELASRNYSSRDWVGDAMAADVLRMDAGSWFGKEFANLHVPSLHDILQLNWKDKTAYVELKDATYWGTRDLLRPSKIVDAVLPALLSFTGQLKVISFNPQVLAELKKCAPQFATVLALWTDRQDSRDASLQEATRCGASVVSLPDTMILSNPKWVTEAHEANLKVHAYPVSPARDEPTFLNWTAQSHQLSWQKLYDLGTDAIISDFAKETLDFFRSC